LDPSESAEDPELDYRLTPSNVILQLLALAVFLCVVGFLGWIAWTGVAALFARLPG